MGLTSIEADIVEAPSPAGLDRGIKTNIEVHRRPKWYSCDGVIIRGSRTSPVDINYSPRIVQDEYVQLEFDLGMTSPLGSGN